jgi:deazaflavin-dependent oxidoreductase (nitroreductase family)
MTSEPGSGHKRDRKRARLVRFWRVVNPLARPLAGIAPWWVLLETTGRRSGQPRRTPLARGPMDEKTMWLIAVHGRRSAWVRNVAEHPAVRVRLAGRWHEGTASIHAYDDALVSRFNRYARSGPKTVGIDPSLVRVDLAERGP